MKEKKMNQYPKRESHEETDVLVLLKKIHQQLAFLERKIDGLMNQSSEKSYGDRDSRPAKSYSSSKPSYGSSKPSYGSKPSYSSSQHHDKHEGSKERSFRPGQRFDKRPGDGEGQSFRGPRRDSNDDRERGAVKSNPFKKNYGPKKSEGAPRKKGSYKKK